jgi:galactoside O-acetyltransferase
MSQQVSEKLTVLFEEAGRSLERGDLAGGISSLFMAYELSPHMPDLNLHLGTLLWQKGDLRSAAIFLSRSILLNPSDKVARDRLARLYDLLGDTAASQTIRSLQPEAAERTTSSASTLELPGTWGECRAYLSIGERVILTPQSNCEVRYRPHAPSPCIEIGDDTRIQGSLSILRRGATIRIGRRTLIDAALIISGHRISIGDDVTIDSGATFMDNDSHSMIWEERADDVSQCGRDWRDHPTDFIRNKDWSNVRFGEIRIEDRAWIGFNSSVLKGVTIGEGAIILPGSIVSRDVAPYTIVGGNPAVPQRGMVAPESAHV